VRSGGAAQLFRRRAGDGRAHCRMDQRRPRKWS